MPSPFPGMDPYLERVAVWHDFHDTFCLVLRKELLARLGDNYDAAYDDHVWIVYPDAPEARIACADVHVAAAVDAAAADEVGTTPAPDGAVTATIEPAGVELREGYLEIRDRSDGRVVTVIELLSPTNKRPGPDRGRYLAKRDAYLASDTHLVELDFLRGGPRMPVGGLPACDYYAAVSRVPDRPAARVWPVRLRERLPSIDVPLDAGEAPLRVDLQEVLTAAFDFGGFARRAYAGPPEPPLSPDDAAWAEGLLGARA